MKTLKITKKCEEYLLQAQNIEDELNRVIKKCEESMEKCIQEANSLTNARQEKLHSISYNIQKELSELGMPKAKFTCELKNSYNLYDSIKLNEYDQTQICQKA